MIKLSFIVPVYNVKAYLRKCVDSLLHQNYDDYEIILVDDGSTDPSGLIVDQLACDVRCNMENGICGPEIHVIHQENKGLSGARNTGIAAARGEYICFVDSDDYWEPNVLGGLMAQIEREKLDVLRFTYQNVHIKNDKYEVFQPYKHSHYVDHQTDIVDGLQFLNNRLGYQCYAWQFIVKTEIVKEERFTEGINYEDVEWTPRMLLQAQRVNSIDKVVYNYLLREGSITANRDKGRQQKNTEDKFVVLDTLQKLKMQYSELTWVKCMMTMTIIGITSNAAIFLPDEYMNYIKRLQRLEAIPVCVSLPDRSKRLQAMLLNLSPRLYKIYIQIRNNA